MQAHNRLTLRIFFFLWVIVSVSVSAELPEPYKQLISKYNFKKGDTEGFVNYGLTIKGVKFAAIFIENEADEIIKISLRSKGNFNVNEFSRDNFNGGGHINAAGGYSKENLKDTVSKFKKLLPQYKTKLSK